MTLRKRDMMWHFQIGSAVVIGALIGCRAPNERAAIENVLALQAAAWNRGDIDGFMDHYRKSDDLTFSASGRTTRGWNATLQRYRTRYPDRAAMGHLRFADLETTLLAPGVALVLGDWRLDREHDDLGGNFSLVLQKIGGRWLIRHDHTSRRVPE